MFVHYMVSCVLILSDLQPSYIMLGPQALQRGSSIERESLALIWPKTVPRCPVICQVCDEFGHEVTKLHQDMLQGSSMDYCAVVTLWDGSPRPLNYCSCLCLKC